MKRKLCFNLILILFTIHAFGQQKQYEFPAPQGWQTEELNFPIKFAPGIPLSGTEQLHLSPGWGKPESEQYWSYVFVWFLDGKVKPGKAQLEDYLKQYYTGLYLSNLGKKPKPTTEITSAAVKSVGTKGQDLYYQGEINTLNFLNGKPLVLHLSLDIRRLADGHTAFLYKISPQPYGHAIWKTLAEVLNGFKVENQK